DRDIAMVFQSYALYPHMSVYDNMAFGLKLRKVAKSDIDRRVKDAARILGLENLQKKPRELSGGQRQRVALGRAIVREPAVFLMDEPLSNLDGKLRVQTRAEIARLHQRLGTTTVYVTHDQVEAMTMGTRLAVMDKGELQQVGAPQDLYDGPRKLFVAGFIGSPAMNFVNVERDGDFVKGDGMAFPIPTRYRSGMDGTSTLVAGFRPEHLELGELPNSATIRAKADVVEFLGDEELLHVSVQGHEGDVVAVVSSENRVKPGDVLDLKLAGEQLLHGGRPLQREAVAEARRGALLEEVAREQDIRVRDHDGDVAVRMRSAVVAELDDAIADLDRRALLERPLRRVDDDFADLGGDLGQLPRDLLDHPRAIPQELLGGPDMAPDGRGPEDAVAE